MTAEIAIMNKEAIAIAADSAVTLREGKIFNSANKIFSLSKYHPVGVMIYGAADFMGIPWETMLKTYRGGLDTKKFDTLKEYANDFINFLIWEKRLIPESEQEKHFKFNVYSYFSFIRKEIEEEIEEIIIERDEIADNELEEITSKIIKKHCDRWAKAELDTSIPENYTKDLIDGYETTIDEAKKDVLENLPLDKALSKQLTEVAVSLFVKFSDRFIHEKILHSSGVVIAGFGTEDIFPSLQSVLIEGVVNNNLKYKIYDAAEITFQNSASIVPFAQHEMVDIFMEGVEPGYGMVIEEYLYQIFEKYPEDIIDSIEELDADEKRKSKEKLKGAGSELLDRHKEELRKYRRTNYVNPVLDVVSALPKDELAAMAESLVNLTSFKRKMSMDAETVAGPIDVAVISKGDGFIWIKRKHYFERELNPQFFANYYRVAGNEEE
ncbi:MAG: hypothetical protein EF813_00195 [Methanosarcinales archaeon]|nr:MAG: hypothetical protein EF813_00195 [Methanosarcinales archaeon]